MKNTTWYEETTTILYVKNTSLNIQSFECIVWVMSFFWLLKWVNSIAHVYNNGKMWLQGGLYERVRMCMCTQ